MGRRKGKKINPRLEVRAVKMKDLKDAPYNPREIDEESLEGLDGSLQVHGYRLPIIWNERTGHIVGGHQRKRILKRGGIKDNELIDVAVVDMSLEEEKALNIALNNEHIQGKWDYEALAEVLKGMSEEDRSFTFLPEFEIQTLLDGEWRPPSFDKMPGEELINKKKEHECPKCGHKFTSD